MPQTAPPKEVTPTLDVELLHWINGLPHPPALDLLAAVIHRVTWGGWIYYPFALAFLFGNNARHRAIAKLGLVSGITTSFLVNVILKPAFRRARPFEVPDTVTVVSTPPPSYSFPSGQTAVAFAAASLFFLLRGKPSERWAAGFFALLVAWDRMYTGHHYPSDVVGGAAVGTAVSWLAVKLLQKRRPFVWQKSKPDELKLP